MEIESEITLIDYAKNIVDRLTLSVDTNSAIGNLAPWLCDYTKLDADTFFSFKDHEMQIDIINDTNARQYIQKCSQVGLSEGSCRKALGIVAISKSAHIMYVLHTRTFATKFATSRIKPIIETSPMLNDMVNNNAKGAELIGLGSSFMHLGGASGAATGAISVPAKFIFIDELDFCDQVVVGKYESRLKHAPEDAYGRKGTVCKFSTPTLEDYGINIGFKISDQKHYEVRCSSCEESFAPDYFRDIVIPNYFDKKGNEGKLIDLTPEDVKSGELDVMDAYMRCPCCMHDVWEDLCDPSRRKWVPKFPDAISSGYQVHPWDVPKVNSIPSIIMQLAEYENTADYYNFTIGIPFADKNNSFLLGAFTGKDFSRWLELKVEGDRSSYCLGCDVGRTSNIAVGKKDINGRYHVVYLERFKASVEETLGERLIVIMKAFKCRSAVIDAMPDFTTAQTVAKKFPSRLILACEYTRAKGKGKMANFEVDEEKHLLSAYRTGVLTDYLKAHNSGDVLYPNSAEGSYIKGEIDEVKLNLKNLKKVKKLDGEGEDVETFVKTGPDHYGHTISYMKMACDALGDFIHQKAADAAPVNITTFNTQGLQNVASPVFGIGMTTPR